MSCKRNCVTACDASEWPWSRGSDVRDGSGSARLRYKRCVARRAFSLMELMVVIVILGLLAGLVVAKTRSYIVLSKQNSSRVELAKIREAMESFYAVYGRYPTNEEGVRALVEPSPKFPDGLLNKIPKDPWGNPYVYNNPGKEAAYDLICYGADGREGGEGADMDLRDEETDGN
ncbi:MAG TPA: type II secretion system protein GspG [Planctomycetaceae bacterium]|nr:type II secretion system protein GspG [Planctomycetaceae bacterium]